MGKITGPLEKLEDSPLQTPFRELFLFGTVAALAGDLTGAVLSTLLFSTLMSSDFMGGYVICSFLLGFMVFLPSSIVVGLLSARLGQVVSRRRPNRVKKATALLGFSLGVATWVIWSVLAVILKINSNLA